MTTYGIYSTWCEGTVTDGQQTMLVNGLSECPSSTTAFAFGPNTPVDLTWVNVDSTSVSASGVAVFTVSAEQIALLYRSSDLTSSIATRSTAAVSAGASETGAVIGGGQQGRGLSNGTVAGIAIGAAAVGIAAVLAAVCLFWRHRRGTRAARLREKELYAAGGRPPSGPDAVNLMPQHQGPVALPASGTGQPASPRRQYELPASASKPPRESPAVAGRPMQTPSAVELHGSSPGRQQPLVGPFPRGSGESVRQKTQGGVESGGMYEISATARGDGQEAYG